MSEPRSSHLPPFDRDAFRAELADRLISATAATSRKRRTRAQVRDQFGTARQHGLRRRHQQKEHRMRVQTLFERGQTVRVNEDHDFHGDRKGTITEVVTEPGQETVYTIRLADDPEPDYVTVPATKLQPAEPDHLDFAETSHVLKELRDTAAMTGAFGSLDSADRAERLFALARIATLAGRASWLELCEQRLEARNGIHPTSPRP